MSESPSCDCPAPTFCAEAAEPRPVSKSTSRPAYVFSGMKVAAILAVAGAIVGEFLGSDRGLGYLMLQVQVTLDTAAMFMAVILITLIGVVLYGIVLALERML